MLDKVETAARDKRRSATFDVEIAAVATAVPHQAISQEEMRQRARVSYPQFASIDSIYANTGIEQRYVCEPAEWYLQPRTWEERTAVFQRNALALLEQATVEAVAKAGMEIGEIDAIVVNTITGLAVPSLDAKLMNRLPFRPDTERLPIFGIGCGGGVAGLARASRIAQSMPGGNVLFLTVDLCTLCLRINDPSITMFVATALFGDGAAAIVLRNTGGTDGGGGQAKVAAMGEHFWGGTEGIMGWDIKNDGFGIVLSPTLPSLVQERFAPALDQFLAKHELTRDDIDGYLLHPGGGKILDVAEKVLALPPEGLKPSREILRTYGNMSSATAMFILKYAFDHGLHGRYVLAAFGPGFSAYFMVLDL
ncbi:MAG: type III polyketide synthase [Bauldia sp.]